MSQSSLMTWLGQAKAIKNPPVVIDTDVSGAAAQNVTPLREETNAISPTGTPDELEQHAKAALACSQDPLPPNIDLRACAKEDLPHLKRLTSLLLPIPYPENFYKEILKDPLTNNITLLALWHDDPGKKGEEKGRLVGAIRCRLLNHPLASNDQRQKKLPMLYISTLVLLSPYRSHGIASRMLSLLTRRAVDDYGITSVGAHVWEANAEGLEWYRKRGFREVGRETEYYRRLDPHGAVVMQRDVSVMDLMGKDSSRTPGMLKDLEQKPG